MHTTNMNGTFIGHVKNNNLEKVIEGLENSVAKDIINEAFEWSVCRGRLEMIIILLQNGADVHINNDNCLLESAMKGKLNIVVALLNGGANVHVKDNLALFMAARRGHAQMVTLLLERGADLHARNDTVLQDTILRSGANCHPNMSSAYSETIKILLEYGANLHANNKEILENLRTQFKSLKKPNVIDSFTNCSRGNEAIDVTLASFKSCRDTDSTKQHYVYCLAGAILPYCCEDDYGYFPNEYIKTKIVPTKGANKI